MFYQSTCHTCPTQKAVVCGQDQKVLKIPSVFSTALLNHLGQSGQVVSKEVLTIYISTSYREILIFLFYQASISTFKP